MHPPLRPLSFAEILDGAFVLYRRGFATLVGTALLTSVLASLAHLLLGGLAETRPAYLLARLVGVAVYALAYAALTWQLSRLYAGRDASLKQGLEVAGANLVPLLGAWLIAFVLYGLPVLLAGRVVFRMSVRVGFESGGAPAAVALLAIPVLAYLALSVLALSLAFAIVPAVVLEGARPWEAVVRSFRLSQAALVRVGALVVVATVLGALALWGVRALVGWDAGDPGAPPFGVVLAREGLGVAVNALLLPFTVASFVLMYFDLRVRTKGLDLQMVADQLDGERAPAEGPDETPEPREELIPLE